MIGVHALTGPSRDKENRDVRVVLMDPQRELGAQQVREPDVQDGKLGYPAILQVGECVDRGICGEASVPRPLQHATGDPLDHGVVVHEEDERGHVLMCSSRLTGVSSRRPP
jgi:hypothetical protein